MTKNIYALLVGIDNYHPASNPPVRSLTGCINDIKAIEAYLRERIATEDEWKLIEPTDVPWILTNQQATRQAMINGFGQHLCNADSDDVVLLYYAGHGSQEKTPEVFSHLEPDRFHETLICYDSRTKDGWDLADKELAYLISQVAKNNPHIVIILDCCHSGTGTRSSEEIVRQATADERQRPWESFIFAHDQAALDELLSYPNPENKPTGLQWFKGRHIAIAACRSHETAKEYKGKDGQLRGAFSYFLLQTLSKANDGLSYRDLARNINALVSGKVKEQSPQIEATDPEELNQPFLGGAIGKRPDYFSLSYTEKYSSWVIDGGAVHGIPKSSNGGDTLLAIFPVGSSQEQLRQSNVGTAKVTQVLPQLSKVEMIEGSRLSENETYWAVVTSLPLDPLLVCMIGEPGEETGVELARLALLKAGPDKKPSLYVRRVDSSNDADCTLSARNGQYWITKDHRPLIAPIPEEPDGVGYTSERAEKVIQRLEHIARWNNILELENPATSLIQPGDVEMEIEILSGREVSSLNQESEKRVEYSYEDGEWKPPLLRVRLINNSSKRLYCNVLDLTQSYGVYVSFFDERSSIFIPPYQTIEGRDAFYTPEGFLEQEVIEYKEILKLIVSTTEFDASLLEQDGLNPPPTRSGRGEHQSTLNRLMDRVYTREPAKSGGRYDDWMTKTAVITIVRPQAGYQ